MPLMVQPLSVAVKDVEEGVPALPIITLVVWPPLVRNIWMGPANAEPAVIAPATMPMKPHLVKRLNISVLPFKRRRLWLSKGYTSPNKDNIFSTLRNVPPGCGIGL